MMLENIHSVLVADDELPSRRFVSELIKQDERFRVAAVCDSGQSTVAEAQTLKLDAVFLDIQMPEMDGFQVIEALRSSKPLVVFVTAYGDYAVRAFEYEVFDYVKKPIDPARFSQVLDRIHQRILEQKAIFAESQATPAVENESALARVIPQGKKILHAVREDLIYAESELQLIESASNYINVRINSEMHLVRDSLDSFCRSLDSADFVKVHRSFVVNVRWVRKMRYGKYGSAELFLADGHVVPVSRSRRNEVTEILRRLIGSSEIEDDGYVI